MSGVDRKTMNTWCRYTKKLLIELGRSEELGKRGEWVRVKAKVWKRETEKWRKGMEGRTKLDRYRVMKTELKYEEYLECGGTRAEIASFVQCRGGVARLRVETGTWIGLRREERVCEFCVSGEVEDETHMMTRCRKWKEVWKNMEGSVEEHEGRVGEERIGGGGSSEVDVGRDDTTRKRNVTDEESTAGSWDGNGTEGGGGQKD